MFNEMLKTILGLFLATVIVVIILHFAIAGVVKPEIGQAEETAPATSAPTEPETEPTEPETTPETTATTEPATEPTPTEAPATEATEPPTTPTVPRETAPPTESTTPETEPPAATEPPTEATEPETEPEPVTEPTEEPTEETEPTTEPAEEWRSLGTYTLTAYCACQRCCGKAPGSPGYGITATGATAVAGVTIAVDPSVIPYGTEVKINDHIYIAQDTGGAINGSRIDVYFDNHQDALNFGRQSAEVFIRA